MISLYKILVGFIVFVNSLALNQLSFSGGGSFGAVEIGIVLFYLSDHIYFLETI
tara:strand:+ start:356 stop:517 length:162 start_codon:yes stop_codon:yes gene_type:complete